MNQLEWRHHQQSLHQWNSIWLIGPNSTKSSFSMRVAQFQPDDFLKPPITTTAVSRMRINHFIEGHRVRYLHRNTVGKTVIKPKAPGHYICYKISEQTDTVPLGLTWSTSSPQLEILTSANGRLLSSTFWSSIFRTTSWPSITCPKTTWTLQHNQCKWTTEATMGTAWSFASHTQAKLHMMKKHQSYYFLSHAFGSTMLLYKEQWPLQELIH